jgi:hypothetical protein
VITDRYKLIHYYKPDVDDWELLDREKDPNETKSFYNDPAYADVRKELHAEVERLRKEVDEGEPPREAYGNRPFDFDPSQPNPPANKKGKKKSTD